MKTRISEVEAFNFLSDESKQLTFPIFLLRPWPNANFLEHCVNKIAEAADSQPFALGLDAERFGYQSGKVAQQEFDALFDSHLGYKAYFDFLEEIPDAVPVLQPSTSAENILRQLGNATELDRGLVVHQRRGVSQQLSDTVLNLPPIPTDTVFVLDAGWGRDVLQMEAWALPIAERILDAVPDAEIVVMASSFPDSFSHIIGNAEEIAHENGFVEAMRQQLQAANLKYGDWASTRLSQNGGGGSIPARIDISRPSSWQIFRADPSADQNYLDMAGAAQAHPCFSTMPDCWGKQKVAETDGNKEGITGVKMNTSARINAHMTLRAGAEVTLDSDEQPYED
ncbi:MAG: hypothetical protein WA936_01320 [Erythrobacter sp.]